MRQAMASLFKKISETFSVFQRKDYGIAGTAVRPKDSLIKGVQVLQPLLLTKGFQFRFGGAGHGSGGDYAWGEFVRDDRRLELHFRYNLGLVRYHIEDQSASHESYMRELGAWEQCQYPGFSDDPESAFHGLAHDLTLAEEFLSGSASVLRRASAKEALREADDMARFAGDKDKIDRLKKSFRQGHYDQVLLLARGIQYRDRLMESERRMIEIAQEKMGRR
jgi:hypothetical protein